MKKIIYLSLIVMGLVLTSCGNQNEAKNLREFSKEFYSMDTVIDVKLYAKDEKTGNEALSAVENEYNRINNLTDRFAAKNIPNNPEFSDVYRVNSQAGQAVSISEDTLSMVTQSLDMAKASGGVFDITVGPVMDLYDFKGNPHVPDHKEIERKLTVVDYTKVIVDKKYKTIKIEPGMEIDLGGVAKGYATDKAVDKLRSIGIEKAIINAGGNVFALGTNIEGKPWRVGIRDPRKADGLIGLVSVENKAVVSSGDYERFFIKDGVRYHHILLPQTGQPARKCTGTTIVADNSTIADLLSTTTFILGPEKGKEFLKRYQGAEGVLVDPNENIISTDGLNNSFEIVND